ncbi:MAG TPA: hypothetical protein VJT68_10200, partial [Thermoleophilaceae bacterium]|nr:hypothetical protein [Thermoleophilaceae bacterium]
RTPLKLALALALLCAGLATALSPAGAWIGDRFERKPASPPPSFAPLPPGGPVLAISRSGAYAISGDGSIQGLGRLSQAGWSPRGKHVVGVDGRRLVAVTPTGDVKWTLVEPRRVAHPAWSTADGFAVAYLEGHALKVVDGRGDPTTNRVLRRGAAPVTPAWRPHSDQVLTYATRRGAIETLDIQTGRALWATRSSPVRSLAWVGDRLIALSSRSVAVIDRNGRTRRTIGLPGVARELVPHPSGRRAAVVLRSGVIEIGLRRAFRRQLFQGNVSGIAWSRDGRHLLLGWRDAGQWLLLGPGGRVRALHGVSDELGEAGGFPRVAGWCCAG